MGDTSGWSLLCVEGQVGASEIEITEAGVTFGRGEFNTVVLNSGNVSRKHARIFLFEGAPWVQDAGSRNGVFVNGERVAEQVRLSANDSVSMGEFRFQIKGAGAAPRAAAGGGPPKKTILIAAAAAAVLLIVVIGIVVSGGGGDDGPGPVASTGGAGGDGQPQSDAHNLFNFQDPPANKPPETGSTTANRQIDVASTSLSTTGGDTAQISAEQRAKLVKEYLERGLLAQQQGDLQEAKNNYARSVQLDPGCALCRSRVERIDQDIAETTQKHFDAALRYYNGMRYEEAIANWELVLNLQSDKNSEMYQKSSNYIDEAKRKLEASRQY